MARLAVRWDGWIGTSFGKKLDSKLDKMRSGRVMRHPAAWITRGSDAWFGLAAALTNAITTVAAADRPSVAVPVAGARPPSRRH